MRPAYIPIALCAYVKKFSSLAVRVFPSLCFSFPFVFHNNIFFNGLSDLVRMVRSIHRHTYTSLPEFSNAGVNLLNKQHNLLHIRIYAHLKNTYIKNFHKFFTPILTKNFHSVFINKSITGLCVCVLCALPTKPYASLFSPWWNACVNFKSKDKQMKTFDRTYQIGLK